MKLYTLSFVLILSTLLSCANDNSKSSVKQSLIDFTINDKNATAYKIGENLPADIVADKDYIIVGVNEAIKIKVDLADDNKLPVLWEVEGSPIQGKEIEQKFSAIGFKKIVLQVPGNEEVVKFVNVKEKVEPVVEVEPEPTVEKITPPIEKKLPEEKKNNIVNTKDKSQAKKEEKKTSSISEKDQALSPTNITKSKEDKPKVETKPVVTPVKTSNTVNSKPSDFNSSKEEGSKISEPCSEHSFVDVASVSFRPTQDVELGSIFVYTNQSGNVDIVLLENNSPVDRLSGRSVNKGRAQIRLSTLNYTLRTGKSYTLKVNGSGGVTFANLAKCNSVGGGSILQPAYNNNVAIFNIKFNY